jgi:hypothetical protein
MQDADMQDADMQDADMHADMHADMQDADMQDADMHADMQDADMEIVPWSLERCENLSQNGLWQDQDHDEFFVLNPNCQAFVEDLNPSSFPITHIPFFYISDILINSRTIEQVTFINDLQPDTGRINLSTQLIESIENWGFIQRINWAETVKIANVTVWLLIQNFEESIELDYNFYYGETLNQLNIESNDFINIEAQWIHPQNCINPPRVLRQYFDPTVEQEENDSTYLWCPLTLPSLFTDTWSSQRTQLRDFIFQIDRFSEDDSQRIAHIALDFAVRGLTDCNDQEENLWLNMHVTRDEDADYYPVNISRNQCVGLNINRAWGYLRILSDCNDLESLAYPGADYQSSPHSNDDFDWNCDGRISVEPITDNLNCMANQLETSCTSITQSLQGTCGEIVHWSRCQEIRDIMRDTLICTLFDEMSVQKCR